MKANIKARLRKLEAEYNRLEDYVLTHEATRNCHRQLARMDAILKEISRVAHA